MTLGEVGGPGQAAVPSIGFAPVNVGEMDNRALLNQDKASYSADAFYIRDVTQSGDSTRSIFKQNYGRWPTPQESIQFANYNLLSSAHNVSANREIISPPLSVLHQEGVSRDQAISYLTRDAQYQADKAAGREAAVLNQSADYARSEDTRLFAQQQSASERNSRWSFREASMAIRAQERATDQALVQAAQARKYAMARLTGPQMMSTEGMNNQARAGSYHYQQALNMQDAIVNEALGFGFAKVSAALFAPVGKFASGFVSQETKLNYALQQEFKLGLASDLAAPNLAASSVTLGAGNQVVMRSAKDFMGVEPATVELIAAVGNKRSLVIAKQGSDELRMLDYFGAEASVGGVNNSSIILRENPSKAAVLEEFLHGTQSRLGIIDRLGTSGLGSAETHVKDFMIRHQGMLGLSKEDIEILKILKDNGL